MKITNDWHLPEPIYQAVVNDAYVGGGDISVTTAIKPPRIRVLEKRHKDEISEDASRRLWSLLGQAVHHILERGETPGHIKEQRVYREVNGWRLSGQFDLLRLHGAKLSDYKVTSAWSFMLGDKPEWEQQLNLLRWLMADGQLKDGTPVRYDITELEINAILRDWTESKKQEPGYPPIAFQAVSIPVWPLERAAAFALERVKIHQEAEKHDDANLPQCSPSERWAKPDTYAVVKPGAKRATRVFETDAQAHEFIAQNPGLSVTLRPGSSVRCERFCLAKKFCNQYALMRAQED